MSENTLSRVGNFENVGFVAKDWSYHGRFKDPLVRVPGVPGSGLLDQATDN